MQLTPQPHASLVDLLDRVLDRGLVINADIIISLAGVPLVGIKLGAALAGIETMVDYGIFNKSDLERQVQRRGATRLPPTPVRAVREEAICPSFELIRE